MPIGHREAPGGAGRTPLFLNRYACCWLMAAAVWAADMLWVSERGFSVTGDVIPSSNQISAVFLFIAGVLWGVALIPRYAPMTRLLRFREVAQTLGWFALLFSFVPVFLLLSYLGVAAGAPLVDDALVQFDSALGFDWPDLYQWVRSHPAIQKALQFVYGSVSLQLVIVLLILGMSGRFDELSEFVALFMVTGITVVLIAMPFPASSAFLHFGISDPFTSSTVSHFLPLHSGALREFEPTQGMVSLPSYHTILGLLYIYALRRVPVAFKVSALFNCTMIFSTFSQGGHYLADVLAGLALTVAAICAFRALSRARSGDVPVGAAVAIYPR